MFRHVDISGKSAPLGREGVPWIVGYLAGMLSAAK